MNSESLNKVMVIDIPVEKLMTHHYILNQYVEAMEKNIFLTGVDNCYPLLQTNADIFA